MERNLFLSQTGKLLERKHEHLLVQVQKLFVVRHFCLHMLKEMRLSKLKTLSQTDFRALLMEDDPKSQACANSAFKVRGSICILKYNSLSVESENPSITIASDIF